MGSGVTGRSTAKVTALHGAIYHRISQTHGAEVAAAYATANQWGVTELARIAGTGDGTPWAEASAYTYAVSPPGVGQVEEEASAAAASGLAVEVVSGDIGLPFPVAAALRLDDQGMVDPAEDVPVDDEGVAGARCHRCLRSVPSRTSRRKDV